MQKNTFYQSSPTSVNRSDGRDIKEAAGAVVAIWCETFLAKFIKIVASSQKIASLQQYGRSNNKMATLSIGLSRD